jgi:hypothetical protein
MIENARKAQRKTGVMPMLTLALLLILAAAAVVLDYMQPFARRTFVFMGAKGEVFEERLIAKTRNVELDMRRYVEEAILGPETMDTTPLFMPQTRLSSFIYSDDTVWADFTAQAALPVSLFYGGIVGRQHGGVPASIDPFGILRDGIARNFPAVRDVRFFVGGEPL